MGFAQGVDGKAVLERDRFAHQLVGGARVEFAVARKRDHIIARLCQRFADIGGLHRGQRLDVVEHKLTQPRKDATPLISGKPAPFARQGPLGGRHGGVDIGRPAARDAGDLLPGGGVDHGQGFAARWGPPLAIDENAGCVEPGGHVKASVRSGSRGAAASNCRV